MIDNTQKLIYIHKVGYSSKRYPIFEFIFTENFDSITIDTVTEWSWDLTPACDYAEPPSSEYNDSTIELTAKSFDLFCLHESYDREYVHGFYNIHALAYETYMKEDNNDYEAISKLISEAENPFILVFHYGMTFKDVKEQLESKDYVYHENKFMHVDDIKIA